MIGWLDCAAGASGDMVLGALVDAGVPLATLQEAVDAVGAGRITLRAEPAARHGLGGTQVAVFSSAPVVERSWAEIRGLLEAAALSESVRALALDVFARLAAAEAQVHRVPVDDVHFHEVGSWDAIGDVVGAAAGLVTLGPTRLTASPVSLGSGSGVHGRHGVVPIPAPAVLALLVGAPVQAGPAPYEMCTPTGAAILSAVVDKWGPLPPLRIDRVGVGIGGRDPQELPNVLRLVLGEPVDGSGQPAQTTELVLSCNVDDLDPRLWPGVLDRLLEAGAADAWLTPILMKKGRPAHTLSVLVPPAQAEAVRTVLFRETSTLGLREAPYTKRALDREHITVEVDGRPVRVKLGRLHGEVVTAQPEFVDVAAAAAALGRPAKAVLAAAVAAAHESASASGQR